MSHCLRSIVGAQYLNLKVRVQIKDINRFAGFFIVIRLVFDTKCNFPRLLFFDIYNVWSGFVCIKQNIFNGFSVLAHTQIRQSIKLRSILNYFIMQSTTKVFTKNWTVSWIRYCYYNILQFLFTIYFIKYYKQNRDKVILHNILLEKSSVSILCYKIFSERYFLVFECSKETIIVLYQ